MKINQLNNSIPTIQNDHDTKHAHEQRNRMNKEQHKNVNELHEGSKEQIKLTVDKMNEFIDPVITDLKFVYHEDLHEYYVMIINPHNDEVIREIPPKKMLDMYAAMTKFIGLLVDQKV